MRLRLKIVHFFRPALLLSFFAASLTAFAKEGMWVPATLPAHAADMKAMGLEIPVDMLYNTSGTGYNNAVVLFGRGCTGELISSRGLVLTNHHCGYGSVQRLSGPDKDYFAYGYWAKDNKEELPCPGLTVTFIRKMENVTDGILHGLSDTLNDKSRGAIVQHRIDSVEQWYKTATGMDALIKPYFDGNQYWVAIAETYRDIRLTGFPPNGIGTFGGDVENWIWPRHTGDFSLFRIYAGKDNKPADYNAANQPYNTSQFFNISTTGYRQGDFTMVYGFPGTTEEYISSYELKQVTNIFDPIAVAARTARLDVWGRHMKQDRQVFLQYTSKRAGVANGWKKWQGELHGLEVNNVVAKKQAAEDRFRKWAAVDRSLPYAAGLLLQLRATAKTEDSFLYQDVYIREAALGVELLQQGAAMEQVLACYRLHLPDSTLRDTLKKVVAGMAGFYKNYDAATDKDVFKALMPLFFAKAQVPPEFREAYAANGTDFGKWADELYGRSALTSLDKMNALAASADSTAALNDPAWRLYNALATVRKSQIAYRLDTCRARMRYLDRLYMKAQMVKNKNKLLYPDANLTLRLTYGKVEGLDPEGPAPYSWQTTLDDVIKLDDTTSDIFKVPPKLKELYRAKDYGRWAVNGTVPVAFIAANHTSGGNSGSPVLNKKGELIGTNFDRAYEGTMSDYYFDPSRCRNISVDIRYTLFIIEKFGGAGWLVDEMNVVGR